MSGPGPFFGLKEDQETIAEWNETVQLFSLYSYTD